MHSGKVSSLEIRSFQWRSARRYRIVPIAAGLGVLAMLGVGGELTDIWAHLFGLASGALLGIPLAFAFRQPPPDAIQALCAAAALGLLIGSWRLALLS